MRLRTARTVLAAVTAGLAAATCVTAAGTAAQAAPTAEAPGRVSHACSPLARIDGFSDALDKTAFGGAFVGNLSALAVGTDGRIAALSDRSALFTLDVRSLKAPKPESVVPLADEKGQALDSEGLVVDRDGTRL